jgi:hypothetical protein
VTSLALDQFAPGDPADIAHLRDRLQSTAQRAEDAQHELKAVLDARQQIEWDGEHVRKFAQTTEPMPHQLGLVASSYFRAAHALSVYADRLVDLQRAVRASIDRANDAERRRDGAARARDAANKRLADLTARRAAIAAQLAVARAAAAAAAAAPDGGATAQGQHLAAADAQRRLDEVNRQISITTTERNHQVVLMNQAIADYDTEVRCLARLRGDREEAELLCARMLRDAVEQDLRSVSWFEQITDFGGAVARKALLGPLAWFDRAGGLDPRMFAGAIGLAQFVTDGGLSVLELGIRGGGQAWRSGWGFLRADLGIHAPFIGSVGEFFAGATAVIGGAEAAGMQYVTDIDRSGGERAFRAAGAGIAVGAMEYGVSRGFVAGGAALGTMIMPGVGTVVGGVIGFAAGEVAKSLIDERVQAAGAWAGEMLWDAGSGVVRGAANVGSALASGARDVTEAATDVFEGASDLVGNVASKLTFW